MLLQTNKQTNKKPQTSNQSSKKEKTIQKERLVYGDSGTTLSIASFASWGCRKETRVSKKLKTYLKNNDGKLP